jgi:pilus assembly protein CpaF
MTETNIHRNSKGLYQTIFNFISEDNENLPIHEIIERSKERFFSSYNCSEEEKLKIIKRVKGEMFNYGPLDALISDDLISEVMVNGYDSIYIEKEGKITKTDLSFFSKSTFLNMLERIVSMQGGRLDESMPYIDGVLDNGSRINIIIPPASLNGPNLTIRKFNNRKYDFKGLFDMNFFPEEIISFLKELVKSKQNILISGGTGSGKTTLLNALSEFIDESHRIITIEDAAELEIKKNHLVRLQSRKPNIEGNGEITIRALLKNALRMRPDRIIVGECRGIETLDMLQAMNTGHDGSMSTVHANSAYDALKRLETIVLLSEKINPEGLKKHIAGSIDYVIHTERLGGGTRKISEIIEITGIEEETILYSKIFSENKFVPELVEKVKF